MTEEQMASEERVGADRERSVLDVLSTSVARFPGRLALRFGDSGMSFAELDRASRGVAENLLASGLGLGDRVALMLPNGLDWPVIWLGILRAGTVAVPVNVRYRAADLGFVLHDAEAQLVITDDKHASLVREVQPACPELGQVLAPADVRTAGAERQPTRLPESVTSQTLANLQYTSGSTGFPKACMVSHDYWVQAAAVVLDLAGLTEEDVVLTAQAFSYVDPQWNLVMCLSAGAPLVIAPRFSASGFWPLVRSSATTVFYVLGTMPMLLYKQSPTPLDRDHGVRVALCSGIPPQMHAAFEQRWGAPWREMYGLTESGGDLAVPLDASELVGSGVIGKPLGTKVVEVVDERGRSLPDGEVGEIVVRGRPMMQGYWKQPELTAEVLRDGALHTGDLGWRDADGWFRLAGRMKDMVRRGGENISCLEVEHVIGSCPDVVACAVVSVADELFGEEAKVFVQPARPIPSRDHGRARAEEILEYARARLAPFKVPRFVEFVDAFPLTPSERIAKSELIRRGPDERANAYDATTGRWSDSEPRDGEDGRDG